MFFYTRKTLEEYKQDLTEIELAIKNHPYNDPKRLRADQLIEEIGKDNQTELQQALKAENLPTLEENAMNTMKYLTAWSKLHRKQKSLQKKIVKISKSRRIY